MVVETPHLRADAQRNLERILEAACEVFARDGLDASVADVAERAGVGTATIFRRFPTKDDLVAAVLERELEAFAGHARDAAESDDPGVAVDEVHDLGDPVVHRGPLLLRSQRQRPLPAPPDAGARRRA